MDLAQPLSTLVPSVDGYVLTVLARTEAPLTGRRVALLARRGSRPAGQAVRDRLVEHGVVHAQSAGSAVLYLLNRDHLLAEPLVAAVSAACLGSRLPGALNTGPSKAPCSSVRSLVYDMPDTVPISSPSAVTTK